MACLEKCNKEGGGRRVWIILFGKQANKKVINVIGKLACLDIDKSEIDFIDPEQSRILTWEFLTLDESKTMGHLFFILSEIPVQIIVHKNVVNKLQDAGITGVSYTPQGDPMAGFSPIS